MTSRRRSKALISLFAMASVGALVASNAVSATTVPPGTEPAGTEAPAGSAPAGGGGVGEVGGSGCGIPHGPYEDPGDPAGEVRVAWNDPLLSFNNTTTHGDAVANSNPLYFMQMQRRVHLLRRRPAADQQRPVRHVHDRLARPADDHLSHQRGGHVVRRRAGRRRRHAAPLGRSGHQFNDENTVVTAEGIDGRGRRERLADRRRSRRRRDHVGRRGGLRRGVRSRDRCACSRATPTRSPPAWRSTRRARPTSS